MTQIAIAEALDGKVVDWKEQLSGVDYGRRPISLQAGIRRFPCRFYVFRQARK